MDKKHTPPCMVSDVAMGIYIQKAITPCTEERAGATHARLKQYSADLIQGGLEVPC